MNKMKQIGRIAIRQEGLWWNAYYRLPHEEETKNGADAEDAAPILLGSIRFSAIRDNVGRRQAFIKIMREIVDDLLEELFGTRAHWPGPTPAPNEDKPPRDKMN